MNYRSIADLNRSIVLGQAKLPRDIGVVVGIPRSGLLAANLIALHLNLPVTDLDGYLEGRPLKGGARLQPTDFSKDPRMLKALVVDDSIHSGKALSIARERIQAGNFEANVKYACVFADPGAIDKVDFYLDTCPMPRVFEWNIMHHSHLENSCVDIDGVLCRDPSEEENDDSTCYEAFVSSVELLLRPTTPIGWLVTCRLEKYREATVAWLNRHDIRYRNLVMMNYVDKASRMAAGRHSAFKAETYRRANAVLFIESSLRQAVEIAQLSGRSVFCMENREMIDPDFLAKLRRTAREPSGGILALHKFQNRVRHRLKVGTRLRSLLKLCLDCRDS